MGWCYVLDAICSVILLNQKSSVISDIWEVILKVNIYRSHDFIRWRSKQGKGLSNKDGEYG